MSPCLNWLADACGVHDHNIGVSWLADACGVHDHNIGVSRNLRRCGVSPAQETSVLVVVQREFTRLFEEGGVCYPVSQLWLVVVFDRFRNMQATSDRAEYTSRTVEPRIQTVADVDVPNTTDRNCVPISK
ncbi:hypothetical protein Tco_1424568, partial [Tanacetum coccineum]